MTIDMPHGWVRAASGSLSSAAPMSTPGEDALAVAGVAALAEGRFSDALAVLRLAVAPGDPSSVTLLNLAIAEDRAGDRNRAQALMRKVAIREPDWEEPVLRLAESLRADNDLAGAEEAYRYALTLRPNRPAALI